MSRQLSSGEFQPIVAHGPKAEYVPAALVASLASNGAIAASGNFTSALFTVDGYYDFAIGLTSTQTGVVTLFRFIDDAGQVALDSGQTANLTANTAAVLIVQDGKPCGSFKLEISNTGGSPATVSAFAVLQSAH